MLTALPTGIYAGMMFVLGLVFGSFLNVCIHRLPLGESVVSPGSECPHCRHEIRALDNVPVLSWVWLRGRCRDCAGRIPLRYPVVELLTGLLFLTCALQFPVGFATAKYCVFTFLLLGLMFTDMEHLTLPDGLTLGGLALGLAFSLVVWVQGVPGWTPLPPQRWEVRLLSLINSAIGAAAGAGIVYLIGEIYRYMRGVEGIGLGDVKLMGMIGAFLGMRLALLTVFAGSAIGAVVGLGMMVGVFVQRRHRFGSTARAWRSTKTLSARFAVPFGTFLGLAGLMAVFWGNRVLAWYWALP